MMLIHDNRYILLVHILVKLPFFNFFFAFLESLDFGILKFDEQLDMVFESDLSF